MKLADVMYCWNPTWQQAAPGRELGAVKVGPHPDMKGWSRPYSSSAGCCWTALKSAARAARDHGKDLESYGSWVETMKFDPARKPDRLAAATVTYRVLLGDIVGMLIRDGIDPHVLHREFCKIAEYRDVLPDDCPGSNERGGISDPMLHSDQTVTDLINANIRDQV